MSEARKCTKCLKLQDISCFSYAKKDTGKLQASCKECVKISSKSWYLLNKSHKSNTVKIWKENNKDKVKQLDKVWSKNNRDKKNISYHKFIAKNPEHYAQKRIVKLRAQPKWLTKIDLDCIKSIYNKAKEYTKLTGIQYHVDHIIPLRGKDVSGLHVPTNLRVTTQQLNLTKGNSFGNKGNLY